ncbi:MAG: DUF2630 family protein [Ktedonobacteraceae bacterium]
MDDTEIMKRIKALVDQEHELLKMEEEGKLQGDQRERAHSLEVSLDQCWDLLRQRRARRNAGLNPDDATPRDPGIVENYKQ